MFKPQYMLASLKTDIQLKTIFYWSNIFSVKTFDTKVLKKVQQCQKISMYEGFAHVQ